MCSLVTKETDVIWSLLLCDGLSVVSTGDECVWIHFAFVHMFKTGGCSHTHSQERKCQCSTSCVSGSVSAAVARHRAGRQKAMCNPPESPKMIYSILCLTFHSPPSTPCTQIQSCPPLPLYTFFLCKGTPATYRTESIPLHTG